MSVIQIPQVQSNAAFYQERAVFDIGSDEEDDTSRNDFDDVIIQNDVTKDDSNVDRHQVTLINTLLNANMHKTTEGNAIRKQLAADPVTNVEIDIQGVVPSESRLFNEQQPILTIEPPSPMPSFSLPENPLCFDEPATNPSPKNDSETITYAAACNCITKSNSRCTLASPSCDATNTSTCNICRSFEPNKNKLTVPLIFDLVSLKLTGERKTCQRSHSASGHDQRRKTPAALHSPSGRCASLSPANSFRGIFAKHPVPVSNAAPNTNANINKVLINIITPPALTYSPQTSKSSGFHRSNEGDLSYLQKYEELPRIGTAPQDLDPNRPSPDQDMGCSPRGKNARSLRFINGRLTN